MIAAQIDAVFSDLAVNAVKIGMLSVPLAIGAVAAGLDRWKQTQRGARPRDGRDLGRPPARAGGDRRRSSAISSRARCVITPNLHEAAALTDTPLAQNEDEMRAQAQALLALGANAVLIKGGHAQAPDATDLLVTRDAVARFTAEKIDTENTHGTGCTLSSAIAAGLAKGAPLAQAVGDAKAYVTAAIAAADELSIGHGHGPVHHFHAWW